MKLGGISALLLGVLALCQSESVDENPDKCMEPETADLDVEWIRKVSMNDGWYVALASRFVPPLDDAESADNFLDHGEDFKTECGRGWLKTPMGDKEVKFKCTFDKNAVAIRKCVISPGSTEDSFIPFARTLRVTHTDNSTYILVYGCTANEDKDKAQHIWVAFTTTHPTPPEVVDKILEDVEDLGFDKESRECALSSKVAWKRFRVTDCEKPKKKGHHMHGSVPMPPEMPAHCLSPRPPKINVKWLLKQRKQGWHIAMSSTEPPPHSFIREPEGYLDHDEDAEKHCGTAKLRSPNGDEHVRWECSLLEGEDRKCVLRLGNTTGHASTIAFSGIVHVANTDNKNYVLLYGCMQNRQKTRAHHVWLVMTTKLPIKASIRSRVLEEVETLGFDPANHFQCTLPNKMVWTEFKHMESCPDRPESSDEKEKDVPPTCWTCSDDGE